MENIDSAHKQKKIETNRYLLVKATHCQIVSIFHFKRFFLALKQIVRFLREIMKFARTLSGPQRTRYRRAGNLIE